MDYLQSLKIAALEKRHDFERLLALWEQFREFMERVGTALAGEIQLSELEQEHLALQHELNDNEHRFIEWHEGDQVWDIAVHSVAFTPDTYFDKSRGKESFRRDALAASVKFEHLLKTALRELHELNEKIAVLADQATANSITKTDPSEKTTLTRRIKSLDEVGEAVLKWGGRAIQLLPMLSKLSG